MFYKYLHLITIPEGTKVFNSRNVLCETIQDIDVLYMDTEQCDKDTMGYVSDDLYFLLHDCHEQIGYPMIESIYTPKILGADNILVLSSGDPSDIVSLYTNVKDKKRIIRDNDICVLVYGPYIIPYIDNSLDSYPIIDFSKSRYKSELDSIIDLDTSSEDDSSDFSF